MIVFVVSIIGAIVIWGGACRVIGLSTAMGIIVSTAILSAVWIHYCE